MAFEHELKLRNIEFKRDIISIGDPLDQSKYDFIFFGGGQDYEQNIVRKDLDNKKTDIKKFIERNGLFLAICGGYQLLGNYYFTAKGNKVEGLKLFDFHTENQADKARLIGSIKVKTNRSGDILLGFENHGGRTYLSENLEAFASVIEGNGNNGEDLSEGFTYKNTIGTYLHGPMLARNENFCKKLVEKIIKE